MNKREALIRLVAGIEASDVENGLRAGYVIVRALELYKLIGKETTGPLADDHIGAYVNGEISE